MDTLKSELRKLISTKAKDYKIKRVFIKYLGLRFKELQNTVDLGFAGTKLAYIYREFFEEFDRELMKSYSGALTRVRAPKAGGLQGLVGDDTLGFFKEIISFGALGHTMYDVLTFPEYYRVLHFLRGSSGLGWLQANSIFLTAGVQSTTPSSLETYFSNHRESIREIMAEKKMSSDIVLEKMDEEVTEFPKTAELTQEQINIREEMLMEKTLADTSQVDLKEFDEFDGFADKGPARMDALPRGAFSRGDYLGKRDVTQFLRSDPGISSFSLHSSNMDKVRAGYKQFSTPAGGLPIKDGVDSNSTNQIYARELVDIPTKTTSGLAVNEQFGDLVRQLNSTVDTDLYRKREVTLNYKSRVVMDCFDAIRKKLQGDMIKIPTTSYFFPLAYDTYKLGRTFGQAKFFPTTLRIKFDKDSNPIDPEMTGLSRFGVWVGSPAKLSDHWIRLIPFGKKKRMSYEFKLAPYYGYVDSMYSILKVPYPTNDEINVWYPTAEKHRDEPVKVDDVTKFTKRVLAPGPDSDAAAKLGIWFAGARDERRKGFLAMNAMIAAVAGVKVKKDELGVAFWDRIKAVVYEHIGYFVDGATEDGVANADMTELLRRTYKVASDTQSDVVNRLVIVMKSFYQKSEDGTVLDKKIRISKIDGAKGYDDFGDTSKLTTFLMARVEKWGQAVADKWADDVDAYLVIPHGLQKTVISDAEKVNLKKWFKRYDPTMIHANLSAEGFENFNDFCAYVGVNSWIRNFTYSLKQERTKISTQRVRTYVNSDSKALKKLVYTFGGEPTKAMGY